MTDTPFVRQDEAMAIIRAAKGNLGLEQFLNHALMKVIARYNGGQGPVAEMDLCFFIETMADLYEDRENLARVFAGEDLRWWSDDT